MNREGVVLHGVGRRPHGVVPGRIEGRHLNFGQLLRATPDRAAHGRDLAGSIITIVARAILVVAQPPDSDPDAPAQGIVAVFLKRGVPRVGPRCRTPGVGRHQVTIERIVGDPLIIEPGIAGVRRERGVQVPGGVVTQRVHVAIAQRVRPKAACGCLVAGHAGGEGRAEAAPILHLELVAGRVGARRPVAQGIKRLRFGGGELRSPVRARGVLGA